MQSLLNKNFLNFDTLNNDKLKYIFKILFMNCTEKKSGVNQFLNYHQLIGNQKYIQP